MVDLRFFHKTGSLKLSEVVALTGAVVEVAPGVDPSYSNVAPLDRAGADDISFLDNTKYIDAFAASKAGACFVRPKFAERAPAGMVLLVTEEPYFSYALTARRFYPEPDFVAGISPHAVIAASAKIAAGCRIDSGAVIGDDVVIGEQCWIGAGVVIADRVEIGSHCRIGANCTLSHTIIGNRAILHRGVHIGQDGFGFAANRKGIIKVPQLGRVVIGDDVEIGSGTCIDRGTGPDTVIGSGSKIDNLVQIAHNVVIGRSVVIAAQCGIAGSTHVGDGVMMGGQVGLSGHVRIGAGAKLAAQAGVLADVPAGATYGGSPAVPIKDWHRQSVSMARLIKKKESFEE